MQKSDHLAIQDASQIAVAGCILGLPIALFAAFKGALRMAESQEHNLAHQVEDVELEVRGEAVPASHVPVDESLARMLASLRRVTAPFEKMGARFEPAHYESETKKLDSLKKKLSQEADPPSAEVRKNLLEVEQLLARYAPQKPG